MIDIESRQIWGCGKNEVNSIIGLVNNQISRISGIGKNQVREKSGTKFVKTAISGSPLLGSKFIYWGHFYIHTFGYVFHGIKMDSLRLR